MSKRPVRRVVATAALAALAALAVPALASPAAAIETAEFGVAPVVERQARPNLRHEVRAGSTTKDAVRVWNNTDRQLTVRLGVEGASIGADGAVNLGGTAGAAGWVQLDRTEVVLPPKGEQVVRFKVVAPRTLPKGTQTAALVAEPLRAPGSDVAVVQRVAVMAYFAPPAGSPLKAALGWALWAAAGLLGITLAVGLSPVRRGRKTISRLATLRFS